MINLIEFQLMIVELLQWFLKLYVYYKDIEYNISSKNSGDDNTFADNTIMHIEILNSKTETQNRIILSYL